MKNLTAASRITLGLVCSMLGILISASYFGLLPDTNSEIIHGRARLTESLAFSTSVLLTNDDRSGIEQILRNIVERHAQVQSVGVRRADNVLVVIAGDHSQRWPKKIGDESNAQYMQVQLSTPGGSVWGKLEVCFEALDSGRWYAFAENSQLKLLVFAAVCGFFSFRLFLKIVLKNLDPSRAVPRRVREALDILNEGLMIVSLDDRILLANNALARTSRRSAESLVGRKTGEIGLVRTDGQSEMPWTECGKKEQPVSGVTMNFLDAHGRIRSFKVNCSPLFGNEGKIRGVMVSLDDVTLLEQNKVELKIAKDEADAANKAKTDFLANMSHEIRNPMNAIVGFTDILRRGLEESEATRVTYLDTIHASGTHLVELINDILDFSKIEAGKLELEIRECSAYQIMTEVVNVMRIKADQQLLNLTLCVEGTLPETIQADPTRLRQILMNLVGNAIKFTAEGSVKIAASMIHQSGRPFVRFEVTDTGIGMSEEQMGRLFQEFMQADSSVTRRFGGTGLGLAISKKLTEAMGGQIGVTSRIGTGSTFHFSIETGDLSGVAMYDERQFFEKFLSTSRTRQQGLQIWFRPARILLTDDTPANRQLAGLVLRKAGLVVDEAENGDVAVEKASSCQYDLMLMDMQMPVMDGFTATRTLRSHGFTGPILAFTANVMEQDRLRCLAAGCTGFLTKPINIDLLLNTLAEYLPTQEAPVEQLEMPAAANDSVQASVKALSYHKFGEQTRLEAQEDESTRAVPSDGAQRSLDEILAELSDSESPSDGSEDCHLGNPVMQSVIQRARAGIKSTLPMEIPEFREIVESFVGSTEQILNELRTAQRDMDYLEIREVAHRLKGTGGTVGFGAFTEPSRRLQLAAEQRDDQTIETMLCELESICSCIEMPVGA